MKLRRWFLVCFFTLTPLSIPAHPAASLRCPAEWEPLSAVMISYPFSIPLKMIAEITRETDLIILLPDSTNKSSLLKRLRQQQVNLTRCRFQEAMPCTDPWVRDFGPIIVHEPTGGYAVADFAADYAVCEPMNNLACRFAEQYRLPCRLNTLRLVGGQLAVDGLGTIFFSQRVLNNNGGRLDSVFINQVRQALGSTRILIFPSFGGIDHLDTWVKPIAIEKILVVRPPNLNDSLDIFLDSLSRIRSPKGTPYQIIRMPYCDKGSYVNALIVNKRVFIPFFNLPSDTTALRIWQEALPDYLIAGFAEEEGMEGYHSEDAIHCRTLGIPAINTGPPTLPAPAISPGRAR